MVIYNKHLYLYYYFSGLFFDAYVSTIEETSISALITQNNSNF